MGLPITVVVAIAAAIAASPASAQSFTVQAVRTANFLDSIGVNVHIQSEWDTAYSDQANGGTAVFGTDPALGAVIVNGRTYTNVSKIIAALRYAGLAHARIALGADYVADRWQAVVQAIPNMKIDLIGSTFDTIWNQIVNRGGKIPNQIEAIEGLNEASVWARWNGLAGVAADCQFQSTLYGTTQYFNRQHGTHIPVLAPSSMGTWNDYPLLATCAWAANAANGHLYSDAVPPTWVFFHDLASVQEDAPAGAPVWSSEAGMSTNAAAPRGMNEDVGAKRMMAEFLSYFANHVVRTYVYELVDENPQTPMLNDNANWAEMEMHYGLFHNDWTPKEIAQQMNAQSVLLADPGATASSFTPQTLAYTLSGAPPSTYALLMQKSTGGLVLALWPEPNTMWVKATNTSWGWQQAIPPTTVSVAFGRTFSSIQVVDTFAGGAQGSPVFNASALSVNLTDHPVYLMLQP